MSRVQRSLLLRYGTAVLATILATLLRKLLDPVLENTAPFSAYYAAVMFVAWYAGLGPSLVTLGFGAFLADYLFIEPRHSILSSNLEHQVGLGLYLCVGVIVALLSESLHASRRRTEAAHAELKAAHVELEAAHAELADANRGLQKEIADREQAEQWLLESEHRFRGYFEQGLIGMAMLSADKDWIEVNHRLCQMLGYSEEELTKKTWTELTYPDDLPGEDAQFQRMLGGAVKGYVTDRRFVCKKGRIVYASLSAQCMRKDDGTLDCVLVLVQDITERKRLEAELASVAQFPRENPNPVLRLGGDGRPLFLNNTAETWLVAEGWKRDTPVPPQLRQAVESVVRSSAPGEFDLLHSDGRTYSWYCVPVTEKEYANLYGRDVTETRRAEEELRAAKNSADRAKAVAELANRAKDYFLAVLSHELRTPLAPVVMGVSMLQDRPDLDQDMRETLGMVRRNAEMEARLIDDLLDVTRISRGTVELQKQRVDLGTVIAYAVEVCRPDIEARGLEFGVEMGPDAPYWVEADITRLQQVFWNLLKNAIKFTPHEGCVGIRCRLDGQGHVVTEVNDSGIGIDAEALPRLFNAFEQAERSISRQFGGLGLGLAISKAMVEMHGGSIKAHSEGRGKGATFRVRLPLVATHGEAEAIAPSTPRNRAVHPLRVLLVEDHGATAKIMCLVLAADGHEVETAGDVATALELADRHPFDLLISDLGLPDGSGHDLMREIRTRGHTFPSIALSGYGQEEDILRSHEAGFAAHLTKPVPHERLVESIASVISQMGD